MMKNVMVHKDLFCPDNENGEGGGVYLYQITPKNWQEIGEKATCIQAVDCAKMLGFNGDAGDIFAASATVILIGIQDDCNHEEWAEIAAKLPKNKKYFLFNGEKYSSATWNALILGWGLGLYQENSCKTHQDNMGDERPPYLQIPKKIYGDCADVFNEIDAIFYVRHLINLPANILGPQELQQAAIDVAEQYKADYSVIIGDELLLKNFPLIHAVGKGAGDDRAPRLVEINYKKNDKNNFKSNNNIKKLTLIGKGVCFDTGGLDLKPASAMLMMKKDMGGAAHVIGLAKILMHHRVNCDIKILLPIVENSVSAHSYRPMDILCARNGNSVEVGDTDAEGRLILADCLSYACEGESDLIIDFATLTGAARVAVGTEIAAFFCNDNDMRNELMVLADECQDHVWPLPLHGGYKKLLKSNMADISSTSKGGFAGAITAALFLENFITAEKKWMHFDVMAWNISSWPAHPEGGEAMGIRAVFQFLQKWINDDK